MERRLIRDYENTDLPLERRLPSLARRFPCLTGARGIDPWSPDELHRWVESQEEGCAGRYAGLFVLNLLGDGPWDRFDAVRAVPVWDDDERRTFANWVRTWS